MLTWAPAVTNLLAVQWWSTPRNAWRPWNSSTAPALSSTGPGANGANGSLNRRTLQSVEHDTTASPSGVTASPLTGPAGQHKTTLMPNRDLHTSPAVCAATL